MTGFYDSVCVFHIAELIGFYYDLKGPVLIPNNTYTTHFGISFLRQPSKCPQYLTLASITYCKSLIYALLNNLLKVMNSNRDHCCVYLNSAHLKLRHTILDITSAEWLTLHFAVVLGCLLGHFRSEMSLKLKPTLMH